MKCLRTGDGFGGKLALKIRMAISLFYIMLEKIGKIRLGDWWSNSKVIQPARLSTSRVEFYSLIVEREQKLENLWIRITVISQELSLGVSSF